MDKKVFLQGMDILYMTLDHTGKLKNEMLTKVYYNALSDLTDEQFKSAVNKAIKTFTFMPKPAELRKLAVGSSLAQAEEAWYIVRKVMDIADIGASVHFDDPAINDTIRLLGGWIELCNKNLEELKFTRNEFLKLYNDVHEDCTLEGLYEKENRMKGYDNYVYVEVDTKNKVLTFNDGHKIKLVKKETKKAVPYKPYKGEVPIKKLLNEISDKIRSNDGKENGKPKSKKK